MEAVELLKVPMGRRGCNGFGRGRVWVSTMARQQAGVRGFSLVEILVVIGIVAVLAALLFPVIARARDAGKVPVCISNLRQIGAATALYQSDHDGALPCENPRSGVIFGAGGVMRVPKDPLEPYGAVIGIYHCPKSTLTTMRGHEFTTDYLFRFVIDFSELNGNRTLPYRLEPQAGSVLAWDWYHVHGDDIVRSPGVWLVLRGDGSVSKDPVASMRKSYLVSGQWTFEAPTDPNAYYQFVFRNEPWPPALTRIAD